MGGTVFCLNQNPNKILKLQLTHRFLKFLFISPSVCLSLFSLHLMKKSDCLSCIISHNPDFANCIPIVQYNTFFYISSKLAVSSGGSIKFWSNFLGKAIFHLWWCFPPLKGSRAWCTLFVVTLDAQYLLLLIRWGLRNANLLFTFPFSFIRWNTTTERNFSSNNLVSQWYSSYREERINVCS